MVRAEIKLDEGATEDLASHDKVWRLQHGLFLHGGSVMERLVRLRVAALAKSAHALDALNIPHGDFLHIDRLYPNHRRFFASLKDAGCTLEELQFVPHMLERDFRIGTYATAADAKMTELAANNRLDVVIGQSVGTLAALEATARRIERGEPLPRLLVLIDPLLGGLTDLTRWYLETLKQTHGSRAIPGLLELYPNSDYLTALKEKLTSVKTSLPPTVVLDGRVGPGYVAAPFAAVPRKKFERLAKKLNLPAESDDDGMGRSGPLTEIWPSGKLVIVPLLGVIHNRTLARASPVATELVQHGTIREKSIEDLFDSPTSEWPIIDNTAELTRLDNFLLGQGMLAALNLLSCFFPTQGSTMKE